MRQRRIHYLRHPNGRGKLFDDCDVSRSTYLSVDSIAAGACEIRDSYIEKSSKVIGDVKVFGGHIYQSFVDGKAVIAGCLRGQPAIMRSIVIGGTISGPVAIDCAVIKDFARVYDNAVIVGDALTRPVIVEGSARVYGTAVLEGNFTLSGKARVCSGHWDRAPRHIDLGFESVTESKLGAMVGCRDRTIEYWLTHGPKLAERWGMTKKQVEQLIKAVLEVSSVS